MDGTEREPKILTTRQTLATVLVVLVVMSALIALNIYLDSRLSGAWQPYIPPAPAVSQP